MDQADSSGPVQLRPVFRGRDGRIDPDPLAVAGPAPRVDLEVLARLFTNVGLAGEFWPGCAWEGVELVWPAPAARRSDRPLGAVFVDVVAELCAGASTVGVNLSGGLDSLAVLAAVCRLSGVRRVVAFTVDLVDDDGQHAAVIAAEALAELRARLRHAGLGPMGPAVELVVVDPAQAASVTGAEPPVAAEPPWSPAGPRCDALPAANATVNQLAERAGCELLLSGNGADELLAAGSFAAGPIARRWGPAAARRYLADVAGAGPGWPGELTAAAARILATARILPAGWSSRAYWAATWPQLCRPTVSEVLAAPHQLQAERWAAAWIRAQVAGHAAARRSWAEADRIDTFWPRAGHLDAGRVPEYSPFLHPDLVAAGLAVPVADRYDPRPSCAYHRIKPQVVALFPEPTRARLPRFKRYYTSALAQAAARPAAPTSIRAGLLDQAAVPVCTDTATGLQIAAVEAWLTGAVSRGYPISAAPPADRPADERASG